MEFWQQIGASTFVTTLLTSLFLLINRIYDNRTKLKQQREARGLDHRIASDREETWWGRNYQSAAEQATTYMSDRRADILELRRTVDELREDAHLEPHVWQPIPDPPRLFPPPPPMA